jgi:hypothetical protein
MLSIPDCIRQSSSFPRQQGEFVHHFASFHRKHDQTLMRTSTTRLRESLGLLVPGGKFRNWLHSHCGAIQGSDAPDHRSRNTHDSHNCHQLACEKVEPFVYLLGLRIKHLSCLRSCRTGNRMTEHLRWSAPCTYHSTRTMLDATEFVQDVPWYRGKSRLWMTRSAKSFCGEPGS